MAKPSKILLVIPCYNEAANILPLHTEITKLNFDNCEIQALFVNDASADDTLARIKELGLTHLENAVNLGIGGTVQLGFLYALENGFDFVVQMDGDGQHPPSQLHKILWPLIAGEADVVIGSRFMSSEGFRSTVLRRAGITLISHLNKALSGVRVYDSTSGFRGYNRVAITQLAEYYPDEYPEPEAVLYLAHKKMKMLEVPVLMNERVAGISSIRSFGSIYYMGKVLLNILFLHFRMKHD